MFKATLDGNGLVIYSDQPEGELLSSLPEHNGSEISGSDTLLLEPSVILKGAFAVKNNWDNMASFDRPHQMVDFAPFDMIRFGLFGSQIYNYLLDRHPNLMLQSVEVEYKELPESSLPVALTMWIVKGGEWSSQLDPFFFREHTGKSDWQIAHLSLDDAFLDGGSRPCPFKTLQDAPRNEGGFVYSEYAYELHGCFKHVELWTYRDGNFLFSSPIFILSGGIGAVRRMSFNFASSQFWGDFQNSAELIQLYERPAPPDPVDPVDPVDPGDPGDPTIPEYVVNFEGGAWFWPGGGYPTPMPDWEDPPPLDVFAGELPWPLPLAIVSVGGGPGGVATQWVDGNNVKWHGGSQGGIFRFHGDGKWQFDPAGMFWGLPVGETIETHCDFFVMDEFSQEHLCRAVATVTGAVHRISPDAYTLYYPRFFAKSTDYNELDNEAVNILGNVFDYAHDPSGWTITAVRSSAGNVGVYVNSVNSSKNVSYKVSANGDFEIKVGPAFIWSDLETYPPGYVFICECPYTATKNGTTRSSTIYVYVTMVQLPVFETQEDATTTVKILKDGQISGQIDFSKILHVPESVTPEVVSVYLWCHSGYDQPSSSYYDPDCSAADYLDGPGRVILRQEEVEPYGYQPGGILSMTKLGAWTYNTNGDFDYMGPGDVYGYYAGVAIRIGDAIIFHDLKIQVGDITQDYFGGEGP